MESLVPAQNRKRGVRVNVPDVEKKLKKIGNVIQNNSDGYQYETASDFCDTDGLTPEEAQEKEDRYERNYEKVENCRQNYMLPFIEYINEQLDALNKIYKDDFVVFEQTDNEYKQKISKAKEELEDLRKATLKMVPILTDENPDKVDALTQLPDIRDVNVDIMLAGL